MSDPDPADIAPLWLWKGTAASGLAAVLSAAALPNSLDWLTLGLVGVAAVGVLALLYRWGQYRDSDGGDTDRREKEMRAEAGGYGGNGGG
ncbi:hypothetical protein [Haloarcula halophila]|uniref:hypothetical protein n=1 Tax=Haloarcula TaxID=2237 RepID=UPI0023E43677|nr:hypothetical protein [Halomicroarcula sp. DFY41]